MRRTLSRKDVPARSHIFVSNRVLQELQKEKATEREILARVLGKNLDSNGKKGQERGKGSQARPFTRFDPDNPEHVHWMNEQAMTPKVGASLLEETLFSE